MKIPISPLPIFFYAALTFSYSCQPYDYPSTASGNLPGNSSVVLIKADVKISVGGILYKNLDALIRIKGFDVFNTMLWTNDYNLKGPIDTLEAKNGFHHYSIELVNKWGINDIQSDIPGEDFWNGRADGPLPVTYNLGGSTKAKKLISYITSRELNTVAIDSVYQLDSRVAYSYNLEGRLEFIRHETYNQQTLQFEEGIIEAFTYDGSMVSKIMTTLNGQPYTEYQYDHGLLDKITETNYNTGIVTTQIARRNYETNPNDSSVSINYSLSNGTSVIYDFGFLFNNIVNDRTRQSGQLCNLGNYAYDKNINPFTHLGYMDFNLQNWSASNKLSEHVDFIGCGNPTLIPLSHYYTYDQQGYPVKKITKYKSNANRNSAYHTKVDFYYE